MTDDFIIDDILSNGEPKKKKNSKRKGKRGESDVCDLFIKRFPDQKFSRVIGSGAHAYRSNLTEAAKVIFTGDIVTPDNFRFCIEVKTGYPEIDLCSALDGGHTKIDAFLDQATKDAERIKKQPLMVWKKDRQPWIAFLKGEEAIGFYTYCLSYRGWYGISLTLLLEQPEPFWFLPPSEPASTTN